jgi:hypothetical protein
MDRDWPRSGAMSLEETEHEFIWHCDDCNIVAKFPRDDFWSALAELKMRNWKITKEREGREDHGWSHLCGKCRRKSSQSNVAEFLNRKPRSNRV